MTPPLKTAHAASIDTEINAYFERFISQAELIDPSYRQLWTSLHTLIQAGGKRLRPTMTLLAYKAFGGKNIEQVIPVAVAQELLHFSLLIHDDIIDRDDVRYGTDNVAGTYKKLYSEYVQSSGDVTHYAHSAALLGGDLMLSAAHEMILTSELDANDKITALSFLTQSIFDVAGGELLDTELSFMPYVAGRALKVAQYKTASYSFVGPLMTGAVLGGANTEQIDALKTYALSLGVAYQLVDDLLGVFGNSQMTGKSTSSDITEGKKTYMVEQALASMTLAQKEVFDTWFGNSSATDEGTALIKKLFVTSGAKKATEDMIHTYTNAALHAVTAMRLDESATNEFVALVHRVTDRCD